MRGEAYKGEALSHMSAVGTLPMMKLVSLDIVIVRDGQGCYLACALYLSDVASKPAQRRQTMYQPLNIARPE